MINKIQLGKNIEACRKDKKISQTQLATAMSITPQAVSRWEKGTSIPDTEMLDNLATYFGTTISSLLSEKIDVTSNERIVSAGFKSTKLNNADFGGIKMSGSFLSYSCVLQSNFDEMVLQDGEIKSAKICDSTFKGVLFDIVSISSCQLRNLEFKKSKINTCEFRSCQMHDLDFSSSEIIDSNFKSSQIQNVDYSNTKITHSIFSSSQITNCDFKNATITDCSFESNAFRRMTFEKVTFKNTLFRYSDCKRVSFVGCTMDKVTYNFALSCKANLNGVKLIK